MEGMGEETLSFPLLKSGKRQKVHLGRSVSTHFVAEWGCEKISEWTNILPVQLVYTEPCKFCNRLQYRLLSCVNDRRNRVQVVSVQKFVPARVYGVLIRLVN